MASEVDDEILEVTVKAFEQHGSKRAAAKAMGVPRTTLSDRLKMAAERGMLPTDPVMPGFRISGAAHTYSSSGELTAKTIQQKPELGPKFEMPDGQIIKGVSALVNSDGREIQKWIKTRTNAITPHLTAALKEVFKEYKGYAKLIKPPPSSNDDLLCVYPIADQHNGLLAWGRETGKSYDLKIGVKRLRGCMAELVEGSKNAKQAIILNLGDWQHTDDDKNMTPRSGNLLDVDSRYPKILKTGVHLMMDCIELALQKHEYVLVRNLPGNHDPHASMALTIALSMFYANNPRVTIDDDPGDFFFHRFGATLIGATHGHKMKPDRMAMTLATLQRKAWGATKFHCFYFGHIHHETMKEVGDVRCESFQTLAENDAFSHTAGFNSGKALTCITHHRQTGEAGRHRVNIPPDYHPS